MTISYLNKINLSRLFLNTSPFVAFLLFSFVSRSHSYLFFHTLVEIFSVLISVSIFMFAWNTRKISHNNFLIFHLLTYKGMMIFPEFTANTPTQLWIVNRYLLAFSLIISSFVIGKKINTYFTFSIYTVVTVILVTAILYLKIFPVSYQEGVLLLKCHHQKINLLGDKNRLNQVLVNLITNVAKYSPSNSKIIIRFKKVNNNILLSVQGFGIGIPKELQSDIFNIY